MNSNRYLQGNIILDNDVVYGRVEYDHQQINAIRQHAKPDRKAPLIFPGFIDIHTHGCNGFDVMAGNENAVLNFARQKALQGVSAVLPTTLTAGKEHLVKVLNSIRQAQQTQQSHPDIKQATIAGIHLEGPYISNTKYRGAQNPQHIRSPVVAEFADLRAAAGDLIKLVTIAPEIENALGFIEYLKKNNVCVTAGHSAACHQQMLAGFQAGVTSATHLFNCMKELSHYELGCVGSVLLDDNIYCEIIGDGKHVIFETVELVLRCKPHNKIMFITDSTFLSGMAAGNYQLGGVAVTVQNNEARTNEGRLAGSMVRMDEICSNLINKFHYCRKRSLTKLSLPQIAKMMATNQADFLNLTAMGKIAVGYQPNFTVISQDLQLLQTISKGVTVFDAAD